MLCGLLRSALAFVLSGFTGTYHRPFSTTKTHCYRVPIRSILPIATMSQNPHHHIAPVLRSVTTQVSDMSEDDQSVRKVEGLSNKIDFVTATIADLQHHLAKGTTTSTELCRAYLVCVNLTHVEHAYSLSLCV